MISKKKARTRNRMREMIAGNGRRRSSRPRPVDRARRRLVESEVPAVDRVPVSSRGQDTWFSATGPGFESPYRYQPSSTSPSLSGLKGHRVPAHLFLEAAFRVREGADLRRLDAAARALFAPVLLRDDVF